MSEIAKLVFLVVLLAAVSGGLACSASAQKAQYDEIIAAGLQDIPTGTVNRFILMVSTEKDGEADKQNIESVLSALHEGGAEKVEPLEGSSIIFVTCNTDAIYKALETGLLSSVQLDSKRKIY